MYALDRYLITAQKVRFMITAGIDIGNQSIKVIILEKNEILSAQSLVISGDVNTVSQKAFEMALKGGQISRETISAILVTGVGKEKVTLANSYATELSCHTKGAHYYFPGVRTVIDIGAENCRISKCDQEGRLTDFTMNDKCATGTGVFLETVAKMLETNLADMGALSLKSERKLTLTTTCAVFAESEIVTEIHRGSPKEEIMWGAHGSVALKTASLLKRIGITEDVVMTGGVAKNIGVVEALKAQLGVNILVPPNPQIVGALGAAILARNSG